MSNLNNGKMKVMFSAGIEITGFENLKINDPLLLKLVKQRLNDTFFNLCDSLEIDLCNEHFYCSLHDFRRCYTEMTEKEFSIKLGFPLGYRWFGIHDLILMGTEDCPECGDFVEFYSFEEKAPNLYKCINPNCNKVSQIDLD